MAAPLRRANNLASLIEKRLYSTKTKQTITLKERHISKKGEGIWHFFTDDPKLPPPKLRGKTLTARGKHVAEQQKAGQDETKSKAALKSIVIPNKIQRSPTAILEALAATVKPDRNQPHYIGIDDPFTISYTNVGKMNDLACKESGRKTAHLMLEMYPDYFTRLWEDPFPEAMAHHPYEGYRHTEPSETALLERISKRKVTDALEMYGLCKDEDVSLSQESLERLLELLTVYNCRDHEPPSPLAVYVENQLPWFTHNPPNTWDSGNAAEQLFEELPEKTPAAYCLLLRGRAHNFDREGSFALYREMKASGVPVDVYTYNKLLNVCSLDLDDINDITRTHESVFRDMQANGVAPNAETFSVSIRNMRRVYKSPGARVYVLNLLSEMKVIGVEPTLSTLFEALSVFYIIPGGERSRVPQHLPRKFLDNVMDYVKGREFDVTCSDDTLFFRHAMSVISIIFQDSKLALQLHDVVNLGRNATAIGGRVVSFRYFTTLFNAIIPIEHTDVVMDIYQSVCPHIYFPHVDQLEALAENIMMHDTYHYIPQLMADMYSGNYADKTSLIEVYSGAMANKKHDTQLQQQLSDVMSSLLNNWALTKHRERRNAMNGKIIGDAMIVFYNNCRPDKAREAYDMYRDNRRLIKGDIGAEALTPLCEQLISEGDMDATKEILTEILNQDSGYIPALVEKLLQSSHVSDQERSFFKSLVKEAETDSSSSDSD